MKVISHDQFDAGLYDQVENATDKITLWYHPEHKVWWAVVVTSAHELDGAEAVVTAFALDRSERNDTTIAKWATNAAARAAHPENEPV